MTERKPPWRDPALPPLKPPGPQHDFPQAWYGESYCRRCWEPLSKIEGTGRPCISDDVMAARAAARQAMARVRRR